MDTKNIGASASAGNAIIIAIIVLAIAGLGAILYKSDSDTNDAAMKDDTAAMMADEKNQNDAMMQENPMTSEGDTMMEKDSMTPDDDPMMESEPSAMMNDTATKGESMMMSPGSYEAYSPEKLVNAESGDVVLFFHASWCPTCRAANKSITETGVPDGLTVLKIDYDSATMLRKKYGVTSQHTFVQVDTQGNLIKKWLGSATAADIAAQTV